jgi:SAM-dependent methyltransferase
MGDRAEALRDREAFRRWNEEMARRYDPDAYHRHPNPAVRAVEAMRVRRLLRLLDVHGGQHVLEVGCGAGNILEQIHGARLFGVDLSHALLDKARARLGTRAALHEAFAESLPFAASSFDRVYCSEVLEHVVDPLAVLREMRRVLRPNGRAVISFPNEALIDRVKDGLRRLGLWRLISGAAGPYQASERMTDEWHLHALTADGVAASIGDLFTVDRVVHVPSALFPLRHVMGLAPARRGAATQLGA